MGRLAFSLGKNLIGKTKKELRRAPFLLEYMYCSIFYARVILSERRQRVHTLTFLVSPLTTARTL